MKNRFTFVATICLLWLHLSASAAHSRTWHVNVSGTGDTPTIEAAIDSSIAGDTISLGEGTYIQGTMLCQKTNLTFVGEGGAARTVLRTNGSGSILSVAGEDITIDGLTFENGPSFGAIFYMSRTLDIKNCIFRNMGEALHFEMCRYIQVHGNLFYSNDNAAYFVDLNNDVQVFNNTFFGNRGGGLYLDNANYYSVWNNLICNNQYGVIGVASDVAFSCNDCYSNQYNYDLVALPDPTGTNGNISVDPQFCAVDPASSGNFLLQSDSPCAPGNHPNGNDCGVIGCLPVGCSTTSIRPSTWSEIKRLYEK